MVILNPKDIGKNQKKPPIKFYINRKDSQVGNSCGDFTKREEAIVMFDKLLWGTWHSCNAMEESARKNFNHRTKEYKTGSNIDLIGNCRRFRGTDAKIDPQTSNNPIDFHGYTLNRYIEFFAENKKLIDV